MLPSRDAGALIHRTTVSKLKEYIFQRKWLVESIIKLNWSKTFIKIKKIFLETNSFANVIRSA